MELISGVVLKVIILILRQCAFLMSIFMPTEPDLRSRPKVRHLLPLWMKKRLQSLRNAQANHREWRKVRRRISNWQKTQTIARPTVVLVGSCRIGKSCLARAIAAKGSYLHVPLEEIFFSNLKACRGLNDGSSAAQLMECSHLAGKMIRRLCRRFPHNLVIETGCLFNFNRSMLAHQDCDSSMRTIWNELRAGVRQNGCELFLTVQMDLGIQERLSALEIHREAGACWTTNVFDDREIEDFAARSLRLQNLLKRACAVNTTELLEINPSDFRHSIDQIAEAFAERQRGGERDSR